MSTSTARSQKDAPGTARKQEKEKESGKDTEREKEKPKEVPKPEAKAAAKPEAKATAKPEAKATAKPEAKATEKPEAKATAKPQPKPETKAPAAPAGSKQADGAKRASQRGSIIECSTCGGIMDPSEDGCVQCMIRRCKHITLARPPPSPPLSPFSYGSRSRSITPPAGSYRSAARQNELELPWAEIGPEPALVLPDELQDEDAWLAFDPDPNFLSGISDEADIFGLAQDADKEVGSLMSLFGDEDWTDEAPGGAMRQSVFGLEELLSDDDIRDPFDSAKVDSADTGREEDLMTTLSGGNSRRESSRGSREAFDVEGVDKEKQTSQEEGEVDSSTAPNDIDGQLTNEDPETTRRPSAEQELQNEATSGATSAKENSRRVTLKDPDESQMDAEDVPESMTKVKSGLKAAAIATMAARRLSQKKRFTFTMDEIEEENEDADDKLRSRGDSLTTAEEKTQAANLLHGLRSKSGGKFQGMGGLVGKLGQQKGMLKTLSKMKGLMSKEEKTEYKQQKAHVQKAAEIEKLKATADARDKKLQEQEEKRRAREKEKKRRKEEEEKAQKLVKARREEEKAAKKAEKEAMRAEQERMEAIQSNISEAALDATTKNFALFAFKKVGNEAEQKRELAAIRRSLINADKPSTTDEDLSGLGVLGIDEESLDSYLEDAEDDSLDSCMESLETTASSERPSTESSDSSDNEGGMPKQILRRATLGGPRNKGVDQQKKSEGPIAGKLRVKAFEFDDSRRRYAALIAEAERVVREIKSALYEADFYGQAHGQGADYLLQDAVAMLDPLINRTLAEAEKLQGRAEKGVHSRASLAVRLYEHKGNLQELLQLRVKQARADNARKRVECDKTWMRIREDEDELAELRKKQESTKLAARGGGAARSSPSRGRGGAVAAPAAAAAGGLTLEGAQALLHAFASVLRPHLKDVIPGEVSEQSPAEAVTLEFLTAASGLQAAPNAMAALNRSVSAKDMKVALDNEELSPEAKKARALELQKKKGEIRQKAASLLKAAGADGTLEKALLETKAEMLQQAASRQGKSLPSSPGSQASERRFGPRRQIKTDQQAASSPATLTSSQQAEMADQVRLLQEVGESF